MCVSVIIKQNVRQQDTEVRREILHHNPWEGEETLGDHKSDGHSEAGKLP